MNYWLMKTEPGVFSIDDLQQAPRKSTGWDGVRNYQVRNMLRDTMQPGDQSFIYHSSCAAPGIAGVAEIISQAYPDPTQFDRRHDHHDPKSDRTAPTWLMVDIKFVRKCRRVITLEELRKLQNKALAGMLLLRAGNRLSITPVTEAHWNTILRLEGDTAAHR